MVSGVLPWRGVALGIVQRMGMRASWTSLLLQKPSGFRLELRIDDEAHLGTVDGTPGTAGWRVRGSLEAGYRAEVDLADAFGEGVDECCSFMQITKRP